MPRYSTEGAIGMKVLSDPSNADLDIVFVHGLAGNRERTWTHGNGTLWPRDLLSKDLSKARIMTFGYDVDIFSFTSITFSDRLYDYSQSLAYAIVSQRIDCSSRPILFIAYSLGGLVCQQALILSTSIDGLWEISSSAIGIIFMGTPQYGSSLASYREKLAKGMKIVHTANRDMVGALHPDSNNVQRLGNEFQFMLRRGDLALKVFCIYEAKNMNGVVGKIVEENSAVLRGYENGSIDADHCNMTKFSGHADGGYGLVWSIITGWLHESRDGDAAANKTVMSASVSGNPVWLGSWSPGNFCCNGTADSQCFAYTHGENFAFD
ncbi:unnamed protein product [Penicillium nalgiovense]|uniref:DUF676 domain-containing protein n=1 Tax=Penicillium nalgiovense TaxID=60175 RepID=A0A9W4HX17_PENNA|nr:unnamed protein product [Penicillium nalgiovense]CAG7960801.1 unnamed protein product [Penicillium nalgiovense]CAG7986215.1 unnamed protein product [Penicillium nalgiovense]CAG8005638.1 unnamed protein product [Penicillium nalgiovense]CAG8013986.1 unnamed protein product [Penicillium nalgiovense]